MQRSDTDTTVIPFPAADTPTTPQPEKDAPYDAVRFNALRHGILSRYTVLPHEDGSEYQTLLGALLTEHQPAGPTEAHLVEELAGIIWRQRRVLQAEGARINKGLKIAVSSPREVIPAAVPLRRGLTGEQTDLRDLLDTTPEEQTTQVHEAELDLSATRKAAAILSKGGSRAYNQARRTLQADSRDWWDQCVKAGQYPPSVEGLSEFIHGALEPVCRRILQEARFTPAIQAQTLGEGLQAHRLEHISRYETHLDRKFERTLAMLLKLKELRSA